MGGEGEKGPRCDPRIWVTAGSARERSARIVNGVKMKKEKEKVVTVRVFFSSLVPRCPVISGVCCLHIKPSNRSFYPTYHISTPNVRAHCSSYIPTREVKILWSQTVKHQCTPKL